MTDPRDDPLPGRWEEPGPREHRERQVSEVRDIWDEGAPFYDEIYANNVPYHRSHEVLVDFLPKARPVHVLGLGAGTGTLAKRILERLPQTSVTCTDFSSKMVAECERKLARFAPRVQFVCADIAVWAPRSCDAVVACNTLVYTELDVGACYARYAETLDPGGLFLNSTVVQHESCLPGDVVPNVNPDDSSSPSRALLDFARRARSISSFEEDSLAVALPVRQDVELMTKAGLTAPCPWQYVIQALLVGVKTER